MRDRPSPNRSLLVGVARELGPLLPEVVFVGGQVTELLITAPAGTRVRPTTDVDVVVEASTRLDYRQIEERLQARGFRNDVTEGAPICRWSTPGGYTIDVMPTEARVLGFTNPWYAPALATAQHLMIERDLVIRIPTAPLFLATKWEAFMGRGGGDLLGSHDLEDIISLVSGRPAIVGEVRSSPPELRGYLSDRVRELLGNPMAAYAVQGALPDATAIPELIPRAMARLEALAWPEEP